MYNNQIWAANVQEIVGEYVQDRTRVAIIGHDKDESTFYLKMFPQWTHEDVELLEPLNATDIRDLYFRKQSHQGFIRHVVPASTYNFLVDFTATAEYQQVIRNASLLMLIRSNTQVFHTRQLLSLLMP
jgi:bifunctional NMN adenylyltransferase/nudix hydrolase